MAEKPTEEKLGWIMNIRDMSTATQGFSYPVFEWSYGLKRGIRGGELRAWPQNGMLVFEDRRGPTDMPKGGWKFNSVEEALAKINEYGWGEPPHIKEIFQDILGLKKKIPFKNREDAEKTFKELKEKWQVLICAHDESKSTLRDLYP